MRRASWLVSSLVALLPGLACSSSGDSAPEPAGYLVTKHPDHAPANVVDEFSITVPSIHVMPGQELTPCVVFPLEIPAASNIIGGGKLETGPGMHHGNLTTRKKTGDGVRPCDKDDPSNQFGLGEVLDVIEDGGAVLFGSSTQFEGTEWMTFPDGMGFPVQPGYEIVARLHYLNVTGAPIDVAPKYTWYVIDKTKVTQELAPFAWANTQFKIPPRSHHEASGECDIPEPMHVVTALPHMHELGREFRATFVGGPHDGENWLQSKGYDPHNGVMVRYDPAVDLSLAERMRFTCVWDNHFPEEIVWGIGKNEMCVLFGYAYPPENAYTISASRTGCLRLAPFAPK